MIFVLALFKISIPQPILSVASFIGTGNGFLAMFMIGLLLEIKINPAEMKIVLKTLIIRVFFGAILMCIVYFFIPIPLLAKKIVVLAMAAPITTVSAVFSKNIGYHPRCTSYFKFFINYYKYCGSCYFDYFICLGDFMEYELKVLKN